MSRCLKRLTSAVTFSVFNKSANFLFFFLFPLFKLAYSKTLLLLSSSFSMDPFLFSSSDNFCFNDDLFSSDPAPLSPHSLLSADPLFLVPFSWWNEVREGLCSGSGASTAEAIGGVKYRAALSSEKRVEDLWEDEQVVQETIVFEMTRECETGSGEEGVSGGGHNGSRCGDLALISEWMFLRALKWHDDADNVESLSYLEDKSIDLFSLQIRLSCMWPQNMLIIRINQKDNNDIGAFSRARRVFGLKSHMVEVWDFSGQKTQLLNNFTNVSDNLSQPDEEILLELQVYGLSGWSVSRENGNGEMVMGRSKTEESSSSSLILTGNADHISSYSMLKQYSSTSSSFRDAWALGLTGLFNLGNTCFMNSAIQCLAHTGKLVDYFLEDFRKDINVENPLGMKGKLAAAFGDLLRKLWAPGASPIAPRMFKSAIADFAPQFSGYNQHDSQEFLSFLLDGLHEDLNRVKVKSYTENKDGDTRPDEEVADEHWQNLLARNSSIIIDLCQGQYRSTLVCPHCRNKSVTFDPFVYLSLPLPTTTTRTMTLTVLSGDGTLFPTTFTINVPESGSFKDLVQALSVACALREDETLVVAEIYNSSIIQFLDDPSDSIELIRNEDRLVAYRMPKTNDDCRLVEFIHLREKLPSVKFGIPLVTKMFDFSRGSEIQKRFLKLLVPLLLPLKESSDDYGDAQKSCKEAEVEDSVVDGNANSEDENALHVDNDFQFFLENEFLSSRRHEIHMDGPVPVAKGRKPIKVLVYWTDKMIEDYDTPLLSYVPEVFKRSCLSERLKPVSLDKCLVAFLKEEPLGPEDMWYCPNCKKHQQASKKLDLWRLPEILVIHLKRFSYTRFSKNKLETFVDFLIDDFDLSKYLIHQCDGVSYHYTLYAISNHYGGMGGGHYTAFVRHKHHRWYEFDDHRVFPVKEEQIKTSAAYVLFYRRI